MRFTSSVAVFLLAGVAALLLGCSFDTPEYSIQLTVDRPACRSADARDVQVTYRIVATDEESLRARYEVLGAGGTVLESGVISHLVLGSAQTRTVLEDYAGPVDEGRYQFHLVGQSDKGDGSYVDMSFLDKTVSFVVDDTAPAVPVMSVGSGRYGEDQLSVGIDLDDWQNPNPGASAVRVYYTLDGSDPNVASLEYAQAISLSASPAPVTLKAASVDEAGNWSSSVAQTTYSFMKCLLVDPASLEYPDSDIVNVFGYGFGPLASIDVEFWDEPHDTSLSASALGVYTYNPGSPGPYPVVPGATQRVSVAVATDSVVAGDPTVDIGAGVLVIIDIIEPTLPADTITLGITDDL